MSNFFARLKSKKQHATARITLLPALLPTLLMVLHGCASQPQASTPPTHTVDPPVSETVEPFNTETLYSLMVAELAGSRDRLDIMLNNYVKQAIDTQDKGITERAAHLANFVRDTETTLKMANQWAALDPTNEQARYMAMAALADAGRYFEAFEHGQYLLNHPAHTNTAPINQALIVQKPTTVKRHSAHGLDALAVKATSAKASSETLETLLKLYTPLQLEHPNDAELTLAISFLAYQLELLPQALNSAKAAQQLNAHYEQAYIQELRILGKQDPEKAQVRLGEIVERFPDNQRLRLQFARNLTLSDLPAAAVQFEELLKQSPNDANTQLALALTYYQLADLDGAKHHFTPLAGSLETDIVSLQGATSAQAATAHYYLGKIAKQQGNPDEAIEHYIRVPPGKEFLPALAQGVALMHQHQQQDKALQVLIAHQLTADKQYQEGISLLLSEHYLSEDKIDEAEQVLNDGIAQFPRSQNLLFNRAMYFVRLKNMTLAESDLRTLIAINPNNADALNTLGYILVDANTRLSEGKGYIERALSLDPDNPAAMDSLGWAYYRLGEHTEATVWLKKALALMPNDEIAAHLGEVLWVSGQQDAAINIWKQGLALNPDSPYIHQRLKQFDLLGDS